MENNINLNNGNNNDNKSIVIKTIYGIIGGIQSILNIISGLCDIFYLLREFRVYVLENAFRAIKYSVKFLKYLLTFKFIDNKTLRLITNIIISFGTSLCLILLITIKKEKEKNIIEKNNEEKEKLKSFINLKD